MAEAPPGRLGLPRQRRIKQARDFARAKTEGKRATNGCLIANWLIRPAGSGSRLGVITSRKVGKAVDRNRARRLLREAFRLHQYELRQPIDLVLVARQSIVGKSFTQVEADFLSVLNRGRLLKEAV